MASRKQSLGATRVAPVTAVDTSEPDRTGAVFDERYAVDARIGHGAMGVVYEGRDLREGRAVAIKVLNRLTDTRRFRREVSLAVGLDHPRLCRVFDAGIQGTTPYLVMERLVGESLHDRLARGRLGLPSAAAIASQLLEAVSAMHRAGILHRDIKPGNVFLLAEPGSGEPSVKVIDFGLAKRARPAADDGWSIITERDGVPGSPSYLSPEQLRGETDLDERVDLWASGVTLYEMLTGQRPFVAETVGGLFRRIMGASPAAPSTFDPAVPTALDAVALRALAKDRDERYRTADAMLEELRAALPP
jgi:serine/threonine protein kinase